MVLRSLHRSFRRRLLYSVIQAVTCAMALRSFVRAVHTLRHAWATPLLEAGVTLRLLQASLGHHAPTTTSVYTHLTARATQLGWVAIHRVMRDL